MRVLKIFIPFYIILIAAHFNAIQAQMSAHDSLVYKNAVKNVIEVYHQNITDQSGLLNGSLYKGHKFFRYNEGHPFFTKNTYAKGAIVYDQVAYNNIDMLYDQVDDVVIVQDSPRQIQLVSERINEFSLYGSRFVRIENDNPQSLLIGTGFYKALYVGHSSLYKKEIKLAREKIYNSSELFITYELNSYYYIKKENTYYEIKKVNDLLRLFKDKRKELEQYIDEAKLNFKKDKDNMLTKVVDYYEQITK